MDFVTCRVRDSVRTEMFQGKKHLVVPVVALKETVLNGHPNGDIYVSSEEIQRSAHLWNNTPITVGHPKVQGKSVSANRKKILEEKMVGVLLNVKSDGPKLKGEMFLQKDNLRNVKNGEDALEAFENDDLIDVSTGYFAETIETNDMPDDADGAHVNIKPDHLALLPNSTGKCSVEDGCGAPRCNSMDTNISQARQPNFDGTETAEDQDWSEVDKTFSAVAESYGWEDASSVNDLDDSQKQDAVMDTLLGDADADTWDELYFFPVVNHNNDNLNEGALTAADRALGSADITEQQRVSAQGMINTLKDENFSMEENSMDEDEAKSAFETLKNYIFGNEETDGESGDDESPEQNEESTTSQKEEESMDELIEELSNSDDVPFSNEQLEDMEEDQLESLQANYLESEESDQDEPEENEAGDEQEDESIVSNLAEELGFEDGDELRTSLEIARNQQEEAEEQREAVIDELTQNARCEFTENELQEKTIGELNKIANMVDVDVNHAANGVPESNAKDGEDLSDYETPAVFLKNEEEDDA